MRKIKFPRTEYSIIKQNKEYEILDSIIDNKGYEKLMFIAEDGDKMWVSTELNSGDDVFVIIEEE